MLVAAGVAMAWGLLATKALADEREPNTLSAEEVAEGWILLFDGKTLFGWEAESEVDWQVVDGTIRATQGELGLLRNTTEFADFVLDVDFRAPAETNSGVFVRSAAKPTDPAKDCYEINIAPASHPYPTGSIVERARGRNLPASDDWQSLRIICQGDTITVAAGGQQVAKYQDPEPLSRGYIGLQFNTGRVEFRNVRLKPLGLESIFNGRDLSGWRDTGGSKWRVTEEGELNVKDGPGQLETEQAFGDFVLQLECFSNGKHLNSGIFFRNIPESNMQGYESQIHNGYRDGDRTQPIDFGTGGIYRRVPARLVVADDFEWFTKTLIVHGPHMAVWVNGIQVTDWTDTRPPDENPRRGLRTEAGTLVIQGHDPTTDLNFRRFRAAEFPK